MTPASGLASLFCAPKIGGMRPLEPDEIRAAIVNIDDNERDNIPLPGLHETIWDEREFLGWRDPERPHRGYLVYWEGPTPVGVRVRAAESTMPAGRPAMCSLCHTQQPAPQVSLFVAPKSGAAGKKGDTVGTYLCRDLSCPSLMRRKSDELARPIDSEHTRRMLAEGVVNRLAGFTARVRGGD